MATAKKAIKAGKTETFEINAPNQKLMKVKITGTAPIIFHRWSEKAIKMILDKQMKKAAKGREIRDPESEYRLSFYNDQEGFIYVPARNLKQAIVGSARFINGVPMTILRGSVFIRGETQETIAILQAGKKIKLSNKTVMYEDAGKEAPTPEIVGYDSKNKTIQMRQDMVTVGMGSADIRFRGQVEKWELEFIVEYDADLLSAEQVLNLIQRAGFSQGLGEWRPEKNGDYGTFEVSTTSEKPKKK